MDVPTYECFLGALASPEEIFIKEAGEHCRRDIDPYRYSMQLNKTRACPRTEKIDLTPSREYNEKEKPVSVSTPDETVPSPNGEVEYEYFEENHLNMNGNVISSTESKVQVQVHVNEHVENTLDDRQTNELNHPIHPKLDAAIKTKTNDKDANHNRCSLHLNNFALVYALLLLPLLLPNLFTH